jgi:hypothetical protein
MASIDRTAYPRLGKRLSASEFDAQYAITDEESPGPATLKHIRRWTERLAELDAILDPKPLLAGLAHTKIRHPDPAAIVCGSPGSKRILQ